MISPLLFGREGAEALLRHCQHKPPPCWFKHQWNSHSAQVSLAASKAKKLCSKSAKNRHLQNNNVLYWFLITEHPRVPPAPLPPTPTVCLSVHLSTSIPHFFSFAPPVSFSLSLHLSMCVCLSPSLVSTLCVYCIFVQISSKNHSCPLFPLRLLLPPSSSRSRPCSCWCESTVTNSRRPQVYQRVWSLLAEPPSCGRSMTKPVRAAHCYSRIDCIWKPMHHVVNELKKWPANIDQISWQPSISPFLWGLWKERAVVERRNGCLFYGNAEQAQFLFCFMASLSDWRKRENSVTFWACRFIHGLRKTSTVKNDNTRFSILTLQSHQVDCPLVLK